ncbi:MAG TPA: hypothetical protein PKH24_13435 [Sedimentisphaerales bacterium]|nr:hypothetical protein [Sedimentisphaerales bacterium]HNU29757.1 hypothetical protein [Sedimentisphaerales bacterium]
MRATICLLAAAMTWTWGTASAGGEGVHLWTFDESEGTLVNDATGGRDGLVHGATWADGQIGSGLRFDGLDDYVSLPDNDPVWLPVNDFTIAFWVCFERDRGSSIADNEVLVDFNAGSSSDPENELGYVVFRRGDTGRFEFQMATMRNTDEDLPSQVIPVKNRWYHVVAVRQGTLQRIYIDGRMDAWRVCSATSIDFVGGYDDNHINVGRYTTTIGSPRAHFKGMLDELMLADRALSSEEVRRLYDEASASHALYVDGTHGSDENDGLRSLTALVTIQKAIASAKQGDVVNVYPGVYREEVRFLGKAITVQSALDAAVIEAPDGLGVFFCMGEGPDAMLRNLVIANSYIGVLCSHSSPTITNLTVVGNVQGVEAYGNSHPDIRNSIFWGNATSDLYGCQATYSCIERPDQGEGNFSEDPLFVDAENGDYHVRSQRGRYWPEHDVWVLDDVSSPCIDAGDPADDFSRESQPNGGRLNIGAHGGTPFAERSELPFDVDVNRDGDGVVDGSDCNLSLDLWGQQMASQSSVVVVRR